MNLKIIENDGQKYLIKSNNFIKGIQAVRKKFKTKPDLIAKILISYFEQLIDKETSMSQIYSKTCRFIENIPMFKDYKKFTIIDNAYNKFLKDTKETTSEDSENIKELEEHYQCLKTSSSDYRKEIFYKAFGRMFILYCERKDQYNFDDFAEKLKDFVKEMDIDI